ncbi:hypothetical protein [Massilia rubra]|uniref:Uncharacterized protein n=1 Tax=Massilia rubra TaxID=2607910 RepID=A0ABX0LHE1_9BURK|nr:hypothetical protein [Massilia rubra]NHZ33429.1 hypothetical protein [Massilia rubra]
MDDFDENGFDDVNRADFDPTDYEPFSLRDLRGRPENGGVYWMGEDGNVMECLICGQHTRRKYDIANKFCDLCRRRLGGADVAEFPRWPTAHASAHGHARKDASIAQEQRYVLGRFDLACRRLFASPADTAALAWSRLWLRALDGATKRQIH